MRRPPTRIELKHDDIEEYDQVSGDVARVLLVKFVSYMLSLKNNFSLMRCTQIVAERNMATAAAVAPPSVPFDPKRGATSPPKRKLTAAERIGLNK